MRLRQHDNCPRHQLPLVHLRRYVSLHPTDISDVLFGPDFSVRVGGEKVFEIVELRVQARLSRREEVENTFF